MPMTLILETDGGVSEFILKPVERSRPKNRATRRIAVDREGRECGHVSLTHDGVMLPAGCTASLYEAVHGDSIEQGEVLQTDEAGNLLRTLPTTTNRPQRPIGPVPVDELLGCITTRAYALTPVSLALDLYDSLAGGSIYRVSFRPRASVVDAPAFLLAGDSGIFLLRSEEIMADYLRLDQPVVLEDEDEDEAQDADWQDGSWDDWEISHTGTTDPGGEGEW